MGGTAGSRRRPAGRSFDLHRCSQTLRSGASGLRIDLPNSLGSTTPQVASPLRLSVTPSYRNAPLQAGGAHRMWVLSRHLSLSPETDWGCCVRQAAGSRLTQPAAHSAHRQENSDVVSASFQAEPLLGGGIRCRKHAPA
jgi:hypothetical protein